MLEIYTDGAYASSIDQGGWGFVVVQNDNILYKIGDTVKNTTNNRMEIEAVLRSLYFILKYIDNEDIIIYSDSMYVIGTLTKHWKIKKNKDKWIVMKSLYDKIKLTNNKINFIHVKGHNGNKYNEICDELAVFYSKVI